MLMVPKSARAHSIKSRVVPKSAVARERVKEVDTQHYRLDVVWSHLAKLKHSDSSTVFEKLPKVALLVLTQTPKRSGSLVW